MLLKNWKKLLFKGLRFLLLGRICKHFTFYLSIVQDLCNKSLLLLIYQKLLNLANYFRCEITVQQQNFLHSRQSALQLSFRICYKLQALYIYFLLSTPWLVYLFWCRFFGKAIHLWAYFTTLTGFCFAFIKIFIQNQSYTQILSFSIFDKLYYGTIFFLFWNKTHFRAFAFLRSKLYFYAKVYFGFPFLFVNLAIYWSLFTWHLND